MPMDRQEPPDHLSQFSTSWTILHRAHDANASVAETQAARQELLDRYGTIARRYLRGLVRDLPNPDDAAAECFQEFGLRLARGAFKSASREHGRFRNYLKSCLQNLSADYRRQQRGQPQPLNELDPPVKTTSDWDSDREFLTIWRDELMAQELGARLGKPLTPDWVRKQLSRAREKFADLLLEQVLHSLETPTTDALDRELLE